MGVIVIEAKGVPAPKGSSRAMVIRGKPRLIASASGANARAQALWKRAMDSALLVAMRGKKRPFFIDEALHVTVIFRLPAPQRKSALNPHTTKPDLDKLLRSTLDCLTGIVFDDDSRVSAVTASKYYAAPGCEGAHIEVWRAA